MSEQRKFRGREVSMVIACKVISNHFSANITELGNARTNWTPEYASDLATRIDTIASNYMGAKTRDELFNASATLLNLVVPAKRDLVSIKKQIMVDFANDPVKCASLLSGLGMSSNLRIAELTQGELVGMLIAFRRNLTQQMLTEITSKGMPATLPQRIVTYVDDINNANARQEQLKSSTKEATGTVISELNALYNEIIGICKIASDYFKADGLKKEMFTFSKILRNFGESRTQKTETIEVVPQTA